MMKLLILVVATIAVLAPVIGAPPSCPCKFFETSEYDGSTCSSPCRTMDAIEVDSGKSGKTCCNATTETDPVTERFVLGNSNGGQSTQVDSPSTINMSDKQRMDNLSTKCYRLCLYQYYCYFSGGKYFCYYRRYCRTYC